MTSLFFQSSFFALGWKHRENFRNYYQQFYPQWMLEQHAMMQAQMQQMIAAGGGAMPPMGFPMMPMDPNAMQQQQLPPHMMPGQFPPPPQFPQPPPQFQQPPPQHFQQLPPQHQQQQQQSQY